MDFFRLKLKKAIVIFEINTLEFVKLQSFMENSSILYQKGLIWVFLRSNFKKLLPYLISAPSNLLNSKFSFRMKNAWFRYFGERILENYSHISNQQPPTSIIAKSWEKAKMLKFGTKNALLGYSWAGFRKKYYHIRIHDHPVWIMAKFEEKKNA